MSLLIGNLGGIFVAGGRVGSNALCSDARGLCSIARGLGLRGLFPGGHESDERVVPEKLHVEPVGNVQQFLAVASKEVEVSV